MREKTMTIYNIPSIVSQALPNTVTQNNIKAEFLTMGIWLFFLDIFIKDDFFFSAATDHLSKEDEAEPPDESEPQAVV